MIVALGGAATTAAAVRAAARHGPVTVRIARVNSAIEQAAEDTGTTLDVRPAPFADLEGQCAVVDLRAGGRGIQVWTERAHVDLGPPDADAAAAGWLARLALARLGRRIAADDAAPAARAHVIRVVQGRGGGAADWLPPPFGRVKVRPTVWPDAVVAVHHVVGGRVRTSRATGAAAPGVVLHLAVGTAAVALALATPGVVPSVVGVATLLAGATDRLGAALLPAMHDAGLEVGVLDAPEAGLG